MNSMMIGINHIGVTSTNLEICEFGLSEFAKSIIESPEVGTKDGSYLVRGACEIRADKYLHKGHLIILDGDCSIDPVTGEIAQGAPEMEEVHKVLKRENYKHFIHSTFSNDKNFPRYRVLIPAEINSQKELVLAVGWFINILNSNGVMLANVGENRCWSQPWYLPRVPASKIGLYRSYCHV